MIFVLTHPLVSDTHSEFVAQALDVEESLRDAQVELLSAVLFTFITASANAALVSRLGGAAAYDDVLDITWVANAALSGKDNWDNQVAWASGLNYLGFDDWRLASMSVAAGVPTGTATSVVACDSATEVACRDNELGYMFYQNMNGVLGNDKTGDQTVDGVLLTDVQSFYWSGTELDSFNAWFSLFGGGRQHRSDKGGLLFGWAVRSGDVSAVPVPAAVWLFGSGLIGLVGLARCKR
jgi:hypothetical protein